MFLLPPVGGGETFKIKKVYLIGTKNKFQFRSYLCLIHNTFRQLGQIYGSNFFAKMIGGQMAASWWHDCRLYSDANGLA